ncbi:ABC transporter ATP-binding protein [Sphaerochaeta halotolerans]|jgi:branched-chain amino acid transport system ATP-binding protein|uniref:ABC transporter ATP-binding protein n=1 Tax=Sphaerochaeta halotolerans TaxID=2293840 RepID=UPI001367E85B|nr:ABC transporter ATP-binding protein [Sphaerochaeta halotolerans]MDK2859872.1 branched-chain amino acid transport system ATP-binding protein [Sphaerochaeta sp.]MDN5333104.1 branched-chain amino acid transport system ATP-binding protein [Sphaerochaeta sp.]MXI85393.1 ATP-binding cassette domain-containing protein [Sphaerochaeta halotolerans]
MILLETEALTRAYGGVVAVNKVDFEVESGLITGLIGPNGAGKTTLFNTMTGLDTPSSGKVWFNNKEITGYPAHKICRMGIARTFQNIRLFKELTVVENVMIGRHFKTGKSETKGRFLNAVKSYVKLKEEEEEIYEKALDWLDFFDMDASKNELAKNLPYGKQRELEIARALATDPKLLFLDEPAAGMNPQETDHLMATIRKIRDLGVTVVLIEHDMKLVMNICDTITVLNYGQKLAQGTPHEIKKNPSVIEAYLGKDEA